MKKFTEIFFNEITPKAVKYSVENPRSIDMDMVQAQQTRQILDKLVGFKLSPVLWKQIGNRNLSAGRVQSVALRMICEREEEIENFIPQEYWSIHTKFDKDGKVFDAELSKIKNKAIEKTIKNKEEAQKIVDYLNNPESQFEVSKVTKKQSNVNQQHRLSPLLCSVQHLQNWVLAFLKQCRLLKNFMKVLKLTALRSV